MRTAWCPAWSRDGQWIYFASDHASKTFHLWKVPVKGGVPVEVTKNSGFAAFESLDGAYVFYAKLSEPGIWRVPRGGGSESQFWRGPGPDNWGNWAVSKDAIYFIESKRGAKSVIERLDLETKRISQVATLERPSFYGLTSRLGSQSFFHSQTRRARPGTDETFPISIRAANSTSLRPTVTKDIEKAGIAG